MKEKEIKEHGASCQINCDIKNGNNIIEARSSDSRGRWIAAARSEKFIDSIKILF